MKKILIVAVATAAIATYLLIRKRTHKTKYEPIIPGTENSGKHVTSVFSRAKQYGM